MLSASVPSVRLSFCTLPFLHSAVSCLHLHHIYFFSFPVFSSPAFPTKWIQHIPILAGLLANYLRGRKRAVKKSVSLKESSIIILFCFTFNPPHSLTVACRSSYIYRLYFRGLTVLLDLRVFFCDCRNLSDS